MTAYTDRYGLVVTTTSREAAEHYTEGLDRMLAYDPQVDTALAAAVEADANFALPHAALANYWFFRDEPAKAAAFASQAAALAEGATPREQRHIEIIRLTVTGKGGRAGSLIDEQLHEAPRDALILLQALGAVFYGGGVTKREDMHQLFESLAPAYGDDWWFLSWRAFSHHEVDRLEDARRYAARALELRRNNGNGVHAMAHVHFETGEGADGARFMAAWFEDYPEPAGFHTHLRWHQALFELSLGHPARALAIYDESVAPEVSNIGGALGGVADAASFLWRCRLYPATAAPLPWDAVAQLAGDAFPRAGTAWADVHRAMALAALADDAGIAALLDGLAAAAKRGHTMAEEVVAPTVRALHAFAREAYDEAATGLEAVHEKLVALGGSNAQRDVFEETLAEAYLRAGRYEQAEDFLRARLSRRTTARDLFWLGRAQQGRGDAEAPRSLAEAQTRWQDADSDSPELRQLAALTA